MGTKYTAHSTFSVLTLFLLFPQYNNNIGTKFLAHSMVNLQEKRVQVHRPVAPVFNKKKSPQLFIYTSWTGKHQAYMSFVSSPKASLVRLLNHSFQVTSKIANDSKPYDSEVTGKFIPPIGKTALPPVLSPHCPRASTSRRSALPPEDSATGPWSRSATTSVPL